jgi:hypothetical protein
MTGTELRVSPRAERTESSAMAGPFVCLKFGVSYLTLDEGEAEWSEVGLGKDPKRRSPIEVTAVKILN